MNGRSIFRRTAGDAGRPGGSRGRARLGVPLALGAVAALGVAASAGTSPAAAAATHADLSASAAQAAHPGPARPMNTGPAALRSAGRVAGSWRKLPAAPVGKPATQALAVWTGSKMIVYGIRVQPGIIGRFNVAYLPASGTWQQLARGPRPDFGNNPNGGNVVAWTGSEMLVLGPTAAAYTPAADTWRPLAPGGPGSDEGAVTGWTGQQELVWGGVCCAASNTGMAYDLAADTWSPMGPSILVPRAFPAGGWDGHELIVAGGYQRGQGALRGAAAYDPPSGLWRRLRPMPHPRYGAHAVWDGTEMLFLGGHRTPGTAPATRGMAYNPATGTWRELPAMQFGRDEFTAVWTGRHVLVWGGVTGRDGTGLPPHGEAFNPATGTWTALPASPLAGRQNPLSVWTGHQMIVWGGDFGTTAYTDGAAFTPRTP